MKTTVALELALVVFLVVAIGYVYQTQIANPTNDATLNNEVPSDTLGSSTEQDADSAANTDEFVQGEELELQPDFTPSGQEFVEYAENETPAPNISDTDTTSETSNEPTNDNTDVFVPVESEFVEYAEDEEPPTQTEEPTTPPQDTPTSEEGGSGNTPVFVPVEDEFVQDPDV